jgi:hypothetical protein
MKVRRLSLTIIACALAGCGTDDIGPTGFEPTQPAGRIRFVHAITDPPRASAVNVTVDGVPLGAGLAYGAVAPSTSYLPAYVGNRQFAVRRTADTTVRLLDVAVPVTENVDYTVIAIGGATVTSWVLTDANAAPAAGNAKLRAVNATAATNVDVYITSPTADILTISPTFAGLAPRAASAYVERSAGAARVRFTSAGTKTVVRDISLTAAALPAGGIRTVLLLEAAAGGTPLTSAVLVDR